VVNMTTTRKMQSWAALLSSTAFIALACGVKNPDIKLPGEGGEENGGTTSTSGKSGGQNGGTENGGTENGGTENGGTENGGTAGMPPDGMAGAGMGGSPLEPECQDAQLRCDGDISQLCEGGMWVDQETCSDVCIGEGVCACEEDAGQCSGNTPQLCKKGVWVDQAACGGATKVCTGEGVCAAFRLLSGGIGTFGVRPAESGGYVLKEQSLSAAPRACNEDFCVTGGIQ
jgi:hypothetical protein